MQLQAALGPVQHHAGLEQAVEEVGGELVGAQHLTFQPALQAEAGQGELRGFQLVDAKTEVGLRLALGIDQLPVAQGGAQAAQGQGLALQAQVVYGAVADGEGVDRQGRQLVGQRQLDDGADEIQVSDTHVPVQPVYLVYLQVHLVQLHGVTVAHLLRQQGIGVQGVEHQPPYGDGHPGLLAEPVGDGALGPFGVEQAEADPDEQQQEGEGVEQAA